MIVVMQNHATEEAILNMENELKSKGFETQVIRGVERSVIGAIGNKANIDINQLSIRPGVEKIVPIMKPFKRVSREMKSHDTVIKIGNSSIGGKDFLVIAGPCAVESEDQLLTAAREVKNSGAHILRGGAFKPRTSPYAFQGMELEGLKLLALARQETGLPVVTEIIDEESLDMALDYVDIIQIGARNMQNFKLLKDAGRANKPVILKRGLSSTIEEWLMAAEYIMSEGNENIILCERGIRTFETATRNTLDISAVPVAKELTHLPIIVDPSHATGSWKLVSPLALAAMAAGAHGVLVEVHPNPGVALCDGPQSLKPETFESLMQDMKKLATFFNKNM
jgi:3-deoxy-7-phosphoheptulonate synthase